MPTSEGTANIAEALAAFQAEMPTVTKGRTAKVATKDGGSYSYTYADLADVITAAMPLLTGHGLAFTATPQRSEGGYELVGMLLHTSGESLSGALPITGQQAQQIGSSLTYLRRYLFGCITGLVTEDDDDGQRANGSRTGDRRPDQAAALWARARRAAGLADVRALWNEADAAGLLGLDVADDAEQTPRPLGERLRQLGDSLQAFDQAPAQQQTPPAGQQETRPRAASQAQHRMLNALLTKLGVDRDDRDRRLSLLSTLIGRNIDTSSDVTAHEMKSLLDDLNKIDDPAALDQLEKSRGEQS